MPTLPCPLTEGPARTGPVSRTLLEAQRLAFARNPPRYGERLDALRALERGLMKRRHDITAAVSQDFGGRAAEETPALIPAAE